MSLIAPSQQWAASRSYLQTTMSSVFQGPAEATPAGVSIWTAYGLCVRARVCVWYNHKEDTTDNKHTTKQQFCREAFHHSVSSSGLHMTPAAVAWMGYGLACATRAAGLAFSTGG